MLMLEERYLARLLPEIKGRHILDVGCGTGRWLDRFVHMGGAASLRGLDSSQEMLQIALGKHLPNVLLTCAELPNLPVSSKSVDLVIASFVLSYVEDLELCMSEFARTMRDGGDLFLSDVHPETAVALGWKRGCDSDGQHVLENHNHSIEEIKETLISHGFVLVAGLEPSFGEKEHRIFTARGKEKEWRQAVDHPAIYMLHFRKLPVGAENEDFLENVRLQGAKYAVQANEFAPASIAIRRDVVVSTSAATYPALQAGETVDIDLGDYLIFPGLVNAHDHLDFGLFPRLGSPPYGNATEWAMDIQTRQTETISLYKQIPKEARLWWGGIRNLLCGATTVCHHNPFEPVFRERHFPVRVLERYGWDHSLAFGKDIPSSLKETPAGDPFFVHAGEGIDQAAAGEFNQLDMLGTIDDRTVLIHGLALTQEEMESLNHRRASLIICPSSNKFLFEKTHSGEHLRLTERLALGSDSPLTAAGDLLDEARLTKALCQMQPEEIYRLVTDRSAEVLKCRDGEGTLRAGAIADMIAVRRRSGSPAEILVESNWRDIELVLVGGRVHLASAEIFQRLPDAIKQDLAPFEVDGEIRWLPRLSLKMLQMAEAVLGSGEVRIGGRSISCIQEGN